MMEHPPLRSHWLHSRSDLAVVAAALLLLVLAAAVTVVAFDRYAHAVEEQAERVMIARVESRLKAAPVPLPPAVAVERRAVPRPWLRPRRCPDVGPR